MTRFSEPDELNGAIVFFRGGKRMFEAVAATCTDATARRMCTAVADWSEDVAQLLQDMAKLAGNPLDPEDLEEAVKEHAALMKETFDNAYAEERTHHADE